MKKKLIAVAVAGALGVPGVALAQASTVQIYGTLVLNYQYVNLGNASPTVGKPNLDMFNSHDANIGFKGEEALGGGTSAWFQCESTMDVSGKSAIANDGAQLCGRNSAIGFKGNFGNIYAGIWDTPMKITMGNYRPFSTSGAYGMGQVMWNEATSGPNTGAGFTRRQTNTWNYASPNFSGFQVNAAFSTPNEATAQTSASVAQKARLWGVSASYTNGPLSVGGGYENHKNYNPANQATYTGGDDRGWSVGAAYTFMGTLKGMLMYADKKYSDITPGKDLSQKSYAVYGDWAIAGPHRLRGGWSHAKDTSGSFVGNVNQFVGNNGAGGTAANLYSLQYAFAFSKRTEVNFGYSRINNDNNARYRLQTLGPSPTPGDKQDAWVLGAKHTF
jgi:predicted porin